MLCAAPLWLLTPPSVQASPTSDGQNSESERPWDPGAGALRLIRVPPTVVGDVIGGVGLIGAASIATFGDGIALLDRNRVTRGALSSGVHWIAQGVSWAGTSGLELLRGQDVERWPEASATYRSADPFIGRLDTGLSGVAALRVGLTDALLGPASAIAELLALTRLADRLETKRFEERVFYLGPPPLAATPEPAP